MKQFYLILVFLLPCFGFSQDDAISEEYKYKAIYNLSYQPDSTDVNSVKTEDMLLLIGDDSSIFQSLGTYKIDSIMANRNRKGMPRRPRTNFDYTIIKVKQENKLYYLEKILKDKFKYIEPLDQLHWEINPETKQLLGYEVQKAITTFAGRKYTAWFTMKIPIADGPYKFNGLPGLILEIVDNQGFYHFTLSGFEKLDKPLQNELELNVYQRVSKKELLKLKEDYDRDPEAAFNRIGARIEFKPGQREEMMSERRAALKKKNNPIELE